MISIFSADFSWDFQPFFPVDFRGARAEEKIEENIFFSILFFYTDCDTNTWMGFAIM
jgi:hypothetical protein